MKLREANRNDAHSIANIQVKAWQLAYADIMPKLYLDSLSVDEKTESWIKVLSEKDLGNNIVIEDNGLILGFCVFGPARDKDLSNKNQGELVALNILPDHWGEGLGSALIKNTLKSAKEEKWQAVCLWVLAKNNKARAIYEAHGFILEGAEKFDCSLTGFELHEVRYIKYL